MLVPLGIQEGKKDMAEKIVVEGSPRALRGKNEARRLRQTGQVPAVLYGGKGAALTLALTAKMKLITEPERVLAHVVALKVEEEKPAEAVAAEAATPAEPEVTKKGKKEVEGEEGAETEVKPKVEKSDKGEKKK